MKSFQFRLERVLSWRGTQLALAEAKLEQLMGGLHTTNAAMAVVVESRATAQATVLGAALVSGASLGVLEASRIWSMREETRLAARILELRQSVTAQRGCAAEARRGVKLVERLKERKLDAWNAEAGRELDELVAESAIAQWRRSNQ